MDDIISGVPSMSQLLKKKRVKQLLAFLLLVAIVVAYPLPVDDASFEQALVTDILRIRSGQRILLQWKSRWIQYLIIEPIPTRIDYCNLSELNLTELSARGMQEVSEFEIMSPTRKTKMIDMNLLFRDDNGGLLVSDIDINMAVDYRVSAYRCLAGTFIIWTYQNHYHRSLAELNSEGMLIPIEAKE